MGDLNFGAEVLWVSRVKLPAKWGTKPHHHEFYHFTYVVSGSGVWKVDGEEFRASAGDCINVPPHIAHSMELDDGPGEIIEIKYTISKSAIAREVRENEKVFPGNALMKELAFAIYDYGRRRTVEARQAGNSCMVSMIYQIAKCTGRVDTAEESGTFINTENFSPSTRMTIRYIDSNYMNDISLETVSAATGYSRNYICTVFRKDCGFTVSTYLNYIRVFHAAEMITYGDYTLQQICTAVGFNDLSYFTKTFRKIVGVPPGQYRQAFPDDIFVTGDIDQRQEGYTLPVWAGRLFRPEAEE